MADTGTEIEDAFAICENELCAGCGACVNICPRDCIQFEEDKYGQKRPKIDKKRCVGCGMCRETCPNYDPQKCWKSKSSQTVYAGWRKDEFARRTSSSGGVASVIAEYVIQNSGVVYGASQEQENILYRRADTKEALNKFKGSKYVQADSSKIYRQIEKDIRNQNRVLVTGTPCLIAGILSYMDKKNLGEECKKYLVTIDLVCHGSVPQKYFEEHIKEIVQKKEIKYDQITFRSNIPGENYKLILKKNGQTVYSRRAESDLYFYSFLSAVSVRESCTNCRYKTMKRCGDITLGDFLGLGKEIPFQEDLKGIHPSLILVNSVIGKEIIEENKEKLYLFQRTLEEARKGGPSLRMEDITNDIRWRKQRKKFKRFYPAQGFEKAARKSVGNQVFLSVCKDKAKKILKGKT